MAIQEARFRCTGTPDFTVLKNQMAMLRGVTAMAIDPDSAGVIVNWEDTQVTPLRIELTLNAIGYQKI